MLDTIKEEAGLVLEATPTRTRRRYYRTRRDGDRAGAHPRNRPYVSEKLQVPVMVAENPLQSVRDWNRNLIKPH